MWEQTLQRNLFWATTILLIIYIYLKLVVYNYWKRNKIPHDTPVIPFGNALPVVLGKSSLGEIIRDIYEKYKKHRFHGIYMFYQPVLVINDPELIRLVLIKEFNRFSDRGLYHNEKIDPLSANLFLLPGEKWKYLRAKLTPIFTSGKLKQMFPLLKEIGDELLETTNSMIDVNNNVDLKDLISRYTTDTISSTVFGFNCKSLEDPKCEFKRHGGYAIDANPVRNALGAFAPFVLDILRISFLRGDVIKFFTKSFQDMVNYRRQNDIVRKDFISLLMQLMDIGSIEDDDKIQKNNNANSASKVDRITLAQAQAQAFVFFLAGYETSSSTVTYCLYELARNPHIQEKVQAEIDEVLKKANGLTYDSIINDYEYLHMVFSETLRKHPSVPFLNRICLEDCDIPNSDFRIKKGTSILISVSGLQSDPDIYPDPDKFDPLRFTKENIAKRSPYVYLPFGDGPRVCIGTRFGVLQSKVALIVLLSHFNFSICEKTPIPMRYSKRAFVQAPEGGVYLKIEKRIK